MIADGPRGQTTGTGPGHREYAVSLVLGEALEDVADAPCISGTNPGSWAFGHGVSFVSRDVWDGIRRRLSGGRGGGQCNADVQDGQSGSVETRAAVPVTFVIDEPVPGAAGPAGDRSMVVRVGWMRSILRSLVRLNGLGSLLPHERHEAPRIGQWRPRRVVDVLAAPSDKLLDMVLGVMGASGDVDSFMARYRVVGPEGRVMHPLVRAEELGDESVIGVCGVPRMPDGSVLPGDGDGGGVCGLRNQGNTCFMNSGLQCLMSCRKLSEYFINRTREGAVDRHPSNASLVDGYSELIAQVHGGEARVVTPSKIKASMGAVYEEYKENEEQDAVEFVTRLLDMLHEGLAEKAAGSRKASEGLVGTGRSIVTDLFFFELGSTLTCKGCGRSKVSVEPGMCLSLPVPPPLQYKEDIVVFYESCRRPPARVYEDVSATIGALKRRLSEQHGVSGRVVCMWYDGSRNMVEVGDDAVVGSVPQMLFCYEYFEDMAEAYLWVHVRVKKLFMDRSLKFNILVRVSSDEKQAILCEIRRVLVHLVPEDGCVPSEGEMPLYFDVRDAAQGAGRICVGQRVVVATSKTHKGRKVLGSVHDPLCGVRGVQAPVLTIQDCLDKFLESEDLQLSCLGCEGCGGPQAFSKKMGLRSLPMYLIIQLKRFQYADGLCVKIGTLVEYPLDGVVVGDVRYRVVGTCNHDSDTVTSWGHYVSYVRRDGWYLCNDQRIERVDRVDKEHTYALFLERSLLQ